jgi:hypothetical protein
MEIVKIFFDRINKRCPPVFRHGGQLRRTLDGLKNALRFLGRQKRLVDLLFERTGPHFSRTLVVGKNYSERGNLRIRKRKGCRDGSLSKQFLTSS